jgi:uncharacterized protein
VSALVERLNEDCKVALKARDEMRVSVLRMLLAKVKDQQIQQGRDHLLTDDQVVQVLASYAKQRVEAAESFAQAGRTDLRDKELRERQIVLDYLPPQLDDDAIREVLRQVVGETGAASMRDLGKVMGPAMARLQGRAEGGRVQKLVRELLGG